MNSNQTELEIDNPLALTETALSPSETLLISYDHWKGSGKLVSMSMKDHMKELISSQYPWMMSDFLAKFEPKFEIKHKGKV